MPANGYLSLVGQLEINLNRESPWSRKIDRAAELGQSGAGCAARRASVCRRSGWDKMTARHLYHIVRALDRVGLDAEARMIAAEAVARG